MPVIAIASPKGGVGKTTLTAHLGAHIAAQGWKVVALDLDPQNALRLHLGLSIREESGVMAALSDTTDWAAAMLDTPFGVKLLPFGNADPVDALDGCAAIMEDPGLIARPVREIAQRPDTVVLLDTPPGPNPATAALLPLIDLTVLVLLADGGSAAMIPRIADNSFMGRSAAARRAAERAVVVLNQYDAEAPLAGAVLDMAGRRLGTRLLGTIRRDEALAEALADKQLLLDGDTPAAQDIRAIAESVIREARLRTPGRRGGFSALAEWGG